MRPPLYFFMDVRERHVHARVDVLPGYDPGRIVLTCLYLQAFSHRLSTQHSGLFLPWFFHGVVPSLASRLGA